MSYWYRSELYANRKVPLLLFLHGVGEIGGDDVAQVTRHGPWSEEQNTDVLQRLPDFFRVAPHLSQGDGAWNSDRLRDLVLDIRNRHGDVEPDRLLLAGISLGGRGALELAALHGDTLGIVGAAVCCPASVDRLGDVLDSTPVYLFHGDGDSQVRLDKTREDVYESFRGRRNFRWVRVHQSWTEGKKHHNCWTHLFRHPDLYRWFASLIENGDYRNDKNSWPDFGSLSAPRSI